ncbi:MAG TPA: hypothetical protein PK056_02465 [Methylotenera sp.]|nr:hypothetical protein [Methylotenera sp.]
MSNFEMYQPSAWIDHGLTHHVSTVVKSHQMSIRKAAKHALIAGSIFAVSLGNFIPIDMSPVQVAGYLVLKQSMPNVSNIDFGHDLVPVGFWPKLTSSMNTWKSVESLSTEHDPEPLI